MILKRTRSVEKTWKGVKGTFSEQNNLAKKHRRLNKYNETLLYCPRITLYVSCDYPSPLLW